MDLVLIVPILWLPVVADFARFGKDTPSAARGAFARVFIASVWFGVLGILYLPATDSGDIPGFVAGMQLGLGALAILFLLQVDEIYATAYATGPTLEGLGVGPRTGFLPALVFVAAVPAAILLHTNEIEGYVLLITSAFLPAFAVILSHAFWPMPRQTIVPALAWASGFVLYQ